MLTARAKDREDTADAPFIRWHDFMRMGRHCFYNYRVERDPPTIRP
jgi:hypothetical protein